MRPGSALAFNVTRTPVEGLLPILECSSDFKSDNIGTQRVVLLGFARCIYDLVIEQICRKDTGSGL